ncbi:MAG: S1 RNA-binding domain-containing protein [Thermoanaerobaculia bacterium]|nr:S1 RNA-binding domain-containing protein [Thermoanaerobaculia bacterium]
MTDDSRDFAAMLAAFEQQQKGAARAKPEVGDRLEATIVGFGADAAFVDLGGKAEGIVPIVELLDADGERAVAVGDRVQGVVASIADDVVVLRVRFGHAGAHGAAAAAELRAAHAQGLPVDGVVQAVVKGGVEVQVAGTRAFCPISQLDARYVEDAAAFVGQRLAFRITRLEEGRGRGLNLVLSRRALLEEESRARAERARAELAVGKIVRGKVTSLAPYGAFVDLGGVEGLLHVSELGHGRVADPSELLEIGQELEVQVQKIAPPDAKGRERISLSRRALAPDPWQQEAARLAPGSRQSGRVARLEIYGAFVELAPGVDGLLHLSELAAARGRELRHPREALQVGDGIDVVVLSVDAAKRRIALAVAPPESDAEAASSAAARAEASGGFGAMGDFLSRAKPTRR